MQKMRQRDSLVFEFPNQSFIQLPIKAGLLLATSD